MRPLRNWRMRRLGQAAVAVAASRRGVSHKQVLRPASPLFIWLTLLGSLMVDMLPWGRNAFAPDFLAVVLVFWNIHQPRRVGMAAAFLFGLLIDVHDGALFGEHALAYTLLSYGAIALHRRILWFPVPSQSLYVFPLLLMAELASALVRLWASGAGAPLWWSFFTQSLVGALLWPLATALLLIPQKRSVNRDETRPL